MAIEIEAKLRLDDPPALEQRLRALDARPGPTVLESNTYFDTLSHSLRSRDEALRIRQVRDDASGEQKAEMTHKGPRAHGKLKSRAEHEVEVGDLETARELLSALGYVPVLTFEKRRRHWELDGCSVEIDTLPCLGDFVEIEGPDAASVLAVQSKLGLEDQELLQPSYIAMLSDLLRERRLEVREVTFERENELNFTNHAR